MTVAADILRALAVETWNMSLLGRPKVRIMCRHCQAITATRDWMTLGHDRRIIVTCGSCGRPNDTRLVQG